MSDEREPYEANPEMYDSLHEESIRERVDAPREGGPEVPFPLADVEYLLNIIDAQRRDEQLGEPEALVTEERADGQRRIGPGFEAWTDGEFFGRVILLPDGGKLKLHVLFKGDLFWYVALPIEPEDVERCLLDLAESEGIDLRLELSPQQAARRILEARLPVFEPRVRGWLESLADQPEP